MDFDHQSSRLQWSFIWSDVGLLDLIQFGFWCAFVNLSFLACALEPVVVDFWWASELVVAAWERGESKHKRERKLADDRGRESETKDFKKYIYIYVWLATCVASLHIVKSFGLLWWVRCVSFCVFSYNFSIKLL